MQPLTPRALETAALLISTTNRAPGAPYAGAAALPIPNSRAPRSPGPGSSPAARTRVVLHRHLQPEVALRAAQGAADRLHLRALDAHHGCHCHACTGMRPRLLREHHDMPEQLSAQPARAEGAHGRLQCTRCSAQRARTSTGPLATPTSTSGMACKCTRHRCRQKSRSQPQPAQCSPGQEPSCQGLMHTPRYAPGPPETQGAAHR